MRNLSPLVCSNVSVPKCGDCDVHLAVDCDTGRIYFNTETDLIGVDPAFHEETFSIGLEELSDHAIQVTGMQFLQGEESLCVCSQQGDLLVVNIHSKMIESVGSVESGLTAMCWSPDQELLLLLTAHKTIIAMSRDFDPISEVSIHAKEFGEGNFINVGWGNKETQFHGSEGKGAAIKKEETAQSALPWDDRKTRVVWRGDGQFFAVNLIDPEKGNRIFPVWNRECILQYTSEYMAGLESAFAWRPSGNLLVSSQRKPHQHDIVFFEKNGLQHGEFTLPFDKDTMKVKHLEWSSDSSILLVWLTPLERSPCNHDSLDQVLLWTVSNYHWYLKQSLLFSSVKTPVCVQWDSECSHKLHIICKDGTYKQYIFRKSICHSNTSLPLTSKGCEENMSTVAVIDGKSVLMTPFKTMIVPPPMCAYKLELSSQANSVVFCSSSLNDLAVVLKTEDVAIYSTHHHTGSLSEEAQSKLSVKLDGAGGMGFSCRAKVHAAIALLKIKVDCSDVVDISALHHWVWLNSKQMFAISPGVLPSTEYAVLFEIDYQNSTLTAKQSCTVDGVLLSAHAFSDDCIILQRQDGHMLNCQIPTLTVIDYLLPNGMTLKLPRPCHQVANCTFNGQDCIVGLSEHSRFYINDTEIASDCSSFSLHNDFLFLTTHSHQLKCISRNVPLQDVLRYYNTPTDGRSLLDNCNMIESHRAVERGSKIVTVTPFDSKLILQMPRGNLELIHPRCLVLSSVNRLIQDLEFGKAFVIMKKHRINMNMLYDINNKLFEDHLEKLVEQLGSTSNLNIFISDLQNDDMTNTMYKQYCVSKSGHSSPRVNVTVSKVNVVCDILIKELEKSSSNYLTSIVTAHVKKEPTEVGLALKKIKTLAGAV